jgi:ubiquinone/menaquinone biosynthesis C-methylase UbiE
MLPAEVSLISGLMAPDERVEYQRRSISANPAIDIELGFSRQLGVPPEATVVHVGCGAGFMAHRLLQHIPRGRLVGVDTDPNLIERARLRCAAQRIGNARFVAAPLDRLPIQDGYADLSYTRMVLQSHPAPDLVVQEMMRVTRDGGTISAVEADDGGILVHPEPRGFAYLLDAAVRAQMAQGCDRMIGRRMRQLFTMAGLDVVRVSVVPLTSEMVGWEAFLDLAIIPRARLAADRTMPGAEVDRIISELRAIGDAPGCFGHMLSYVAVGKKLPQ